MTGEGHSRTGDGGATAPARSAARDSDAIWQAALRDTTVAQSLERLSRLATKLLGAPVTLVVLGNAEATSIAACLDAPDTPEDQNARHDPIVTDDQHYRRGSPMSGHRFG
jgi:hypothetical protein